MALPKRVGTEAIRTKGWLLANKWLLLRRLSQLSILGLFLAGPWYGVWIIKGSLTSSLLLDSVPMSDPFVALQSLLAGHVLETAAVAGALIVAGFYLVFGGRVYCSWVCPVNMITDSAGWLQRRLGLRPAARFSRNARYALLPMVAVLALVTGTLAWELVNPVTMIHRGLVFGMGTTWGAVAAIFLFDLLVAQRGWCGHLCPMGAFYSLLGHLTPLRVSAVERAQCNDCMDCYAVCPEPQVIKPALKGTDQGSGPVIESANCTTCGRCFDVCAKDVFRLANRFSHPPIRNEQKHKEVTP